MKKTLLRAGVALTAAGALGIGMAGTAVADDDKDKPVTATPAVKDGWSVNGTADSSVDSIEAGLISLSTADGGNSPVYCIDLFTKLDTTHQYEKGGWDDSGVKNLPKVQWVLHNSYPNVAPADLAEKAGAETEGIDEPKLEQAVYTATQTAVWSLTDGFVLNNEDATEADPAVDAVVSSINTYLLDNAKEMPEPVTDISLDGPEKFENSERGGPFALSTPGVTTLEAKGAKVVDENDKELKKVESGQEFYLLPDEDTESISLSAKTETSTPSGAVFLSTGKPVADVEALDKAKSQRLILAEALPGEVGADFEFELDTSDTLPVTGMSLSSSLLAGAVLLLVGAAAVVLVRRRRVAASWGDA